MWAGRPTVSSRILEDDRRQHLRVEDDLLGVVAQVRDHRRAPDLGTRPGRRRHRHDRSHAGDVDAREPVLAVFEVPDRPGLSDHEGDGLGRVERAAAAERDHAVVLSCAVCRNARGDVRLDGVRLHVGEQPAVQAGVTAQAHGVRDHRLRREPGVGDEQRPLHAERTAVLGQFHDAPGAELDAGRVVPVAAQGGHRVLRFVVPGRRSLRGGVARHARWWLQAGNPGVVRVHEEDMFTRTTPGSPADTRRLSESSPEREDSHAARRLKVAATITGGGKLVRRAYGRYSCRT